MENEFKLNLVGIIHGTQLKNVSLSPLEKTVLAFINGMQLDDNFTDNNRFLGFNCEHFYYYSDKYNNHLLKKLSLRQFQHIASNLQRKSILEITYDPADQLVCVINGAHTKGWAISVFEIDPSTIILNKISDSQKSDNLYTVENNTLTNNKYEYNYIANLVLSVLLKCASQSVAEGLSFVIYKNQILKLPALLRLPQGILDDAVNFLISINAISTNESLNDEKWKFSSFAASKVDAIYLNDSIISSYFEIFERLEVFQDTLKLTSTLRAFTAKYR